MCVQRRIAVFTSVMVLGLCLCVKTELRADAVDAHAATLQRFRERIRVESGMATALLARVDTTQSDTPVRIVMTRDNVVAHENADRNSRSLMTLQLNQEYESDARRDTWYRITLADGRRAWIEERDLRVVARVEAATLVNADPESMRLLAEATVRRRDAIQRLADSVRVVADALQREYNALPADEQRRQESSYNAAVHMREEIDAQLPLLQQTQQRLVELLVRSAASATPIHQSRYYADAGLDVGSSTYILAGPGAGGTGSGTVNVFVNGGYDISNEMRATASLSHQKNLIETPFSNTELKLGHQYSISDREGVRSYAVLGLYSDALLERNNCTHVGVGSTYTNRLDSTLTLDAGLGYDGRMYSDASAMGYQSGMLNSSLQWKVNSGSDWTINLNGAIQTSALDYLEYQRVNPSLMYRFQNADTRWALRAEAEHMHYSGDANLNNYELFLAGVRFADHSISGEFTASAKQYINNTLQNYARLLSVVRLNGRSAQGSSTTTLSALINYFTVTSVRLPQYLDLRADALSYSGKLSIEWNAFSCLWYKQNDSLPRDHLVDLFAKVGVQVPYCVVGPFVGAHIQARAQEKVLIRDGNSLRMGIDARSTYLWEKLSLAATVRFERDIAFNRTVSVNENTGLVTFGDLRTHYPVSWQYSLMATYPFTTEFLGALNINSYTVNPDVDANLSNNPIDHRGQFNVNVGVRYILPTK